MSRVLGIELRRSAALGSALVVAVIGALLLYFTAEATVTGWMQLAMTQRLLLAVLWPLALAAGAWQGTREHRSKVNELFDTTPRPRPHRSVPALGAMALAMICGYLLMGAAGAVQLIGAADYLPMAFFAVTAVGLLSLVAAVWLGLAAGRAMPWLVTAPALAIAGLALLLLIPGATRPHGWLALVFSPIYEMNMPGAFATVPGPASAAQALWLAALAVAGVLLFVSGSRRARVAAVLPVVLGAALAISVIPHQNRYVNDAIDPVARALTCAPDEPRVCVSRVHVALLPEVTGPARDGLAVLAKLPDAPTQAHEDTTIYFPANFPAWNTDVVLFSVGTDGWSEEKVDVLTSVVAGAFASRPDCDDYTPKADQFAAAAWLIGREPPVAEAVESYQKLRQLPADEAKDRVVALRKAAHDCKADGGLFAGSAR